MPSYQPSNLWYYIVIRHRSSLAGVVMSYGVRRICLNDELLLLQILETRICQSFSDVDGEWNSMPMYLESELHLARTSPWVSVRVQFLTLSCNGEVRNLLVVVYARNRSGRSWGYLISLRWLWGGSRSKNLEVWELGWSIHKPLDAYRAEKVWCFLRYLDIFHIIFWASSSLVSFSNIQVSDPLQLG